MALSTLRVAMRPSLAGCLLRSQSPLLQQSGTPMATSAFNEMNEFWQKNKALGRPSSPWIIYKPHLPMLTSLTHRTTGIVMGVSLYGIGVGLLLNPGDFASVVELIKGLDIPAPVLFLGKSICAFPVVYHYINGIRHLSWDAGYGYKLSTQYKTGWSIVTAAVLVSALCGAASYM